MLRMLISSVIKISSTFPFVLLLQAAYMREVESHAFCVEPRMRGALNVPDQFNISTIDENGPIDYCVDGRRSGGIEKVLAASGHNWKPYTPLKQRYRWTAGVCGDTRSERQDHKVGGKYYYEKVVARYSSGQVVDFQVNMVTPHTGYFEFYLCDLDKCKTNDIEEKCFAQGYCQQLKRVPVSVCESGSDNRCGPIDSKYPGRWYITPCTADENFPLGGQDGTMQYKIPNIRCKKCVVQWYYITAFECNPPGYIEYFESKRDPKCPRDRISSGWHDKELTSCGGKESPEEYWGCADISIGVKDENGNAASSPQNSSGLERRPRMEGNVTRNDFCRIYDMLDRLGMKNTYIYLLKD